MVRKELEDDAKPERSPSPRVLSSPWGSLAAPLKGFSLVDEWLAELPYEVSFVAWSARGELAPVDPQCINTLVADSTCGHPHPASCALAIIARRKIIGRLVAWSGRGFSQGLAEHARTCLGDCRFKSVGICPMQNWWKPAKEYPAHIEAQRRRLGGVAALPELMTLEPLYNRWSKDQGSMCKSSGVHCKKYAIDLVTVAIAQCSPFHLNIIAGWNAEGSDLDLEFKMQREFVADFVPNTRSLPRTATAGGHSVSCVYV